MGHVVDQRAWDQGSAAWILRYQTDGVFEGVAQHNADAFANNALGTAAVTDHLDDLVSAINQRAYDVWWTSPNREWLKKTTLWDNSDVIENQQHIRLNMNSVTMAEVFSIPVTTCHTASGTIEFTPPISAEMMAPALRPVSSSSLVTARSMSSPQMSFSMKMVGAPM